MNGLQGEVKGEERAMNCKGMYTDIFECMHISVQTISCLH